MISNEFVIQHPVGLHARPASLFVQTAQKYNSKITINYKNKTVNAKSMLGLLGLGVGQGAVILVSAEGDDEVEALEALNSLVDSNFGEKL